MKIDKKTGLILSLVLLLGILGLVILTDNMKENFDTLKTDEIDSSKNTDINNDPTELPINNDFPDIDNDSAAGSGSGYEPGNFYENDFYDSDFYNDDKQGFKKIRKCRQKKFDLNGKDDDDDKKENPDYTRDDRLSYKNLDENVIQLIMMRKKQKQMVYVIIIIIYVQ